MVFILVTTPILKQPLQQVVTAPSSPGIEPFLQYYQCHRPSMPEPTSVYPMVDSDPSVSAIISSDPTFHYSDQSRQMVTDLQDGARKTLVHTDGKCYPLPRALAAPSSEERTCFSKALRFPKWRNVMTDEFNTLLKIHP